MLHNGTRPPKKGEFNGNWKCKYKNWKSLIKPSKLDVKISDDFSQATIVAEPLEKGFGLTLGNSLRRILIFNKRSSSYFNPNDGVLYEFTSIKGKRRCNRYCIKC